MIKSSYFEILEIFGVPKSTLCLSLNVIFPPLKCSSLNHPWDIKVFGRITNKIVREVIEKKVVKNKSGNTNYLLKDKEEYILSTS